MSQYSVIGKSLPRVDGLEKVTGAAKYTGDIKVPGMLYGRILRSPHAHARVVRLDASKALAFPGVMAILGPADAPRKAFNAAAISIVTPPAYEVVKDQYVLDQRVRYVGDAVAVLAANSEHAADEALKLIEVEYEVLPAVIDPEEALRPGSPLVHDGRENNIMSQLNMATGDLEKGFAEADLVIEETYTTSRQKQCQIELNVSLACFGDDGRLTLWTPCAMPHLARLMVADIFDLPPHQVRVITLNIGGGFGNRLGLVAEPYAVALAQKTGRPVKVEVPRQEDFYGTESRHPCIIRMKAGAKKDGTMTALQATAIVNTGAYATHGHDVMGSLGGTMRRLYACPNFGYEGYAVYTNTPVAGAYRGYGGPQGLFALESHMDALARGVGVNPLEFRLKNAVQPGARDLFHRRPITSHSLEECLRRGAQAMGWDGQKATPPQSASVRRGKGMGCFIWVSGTGGSRRVPDTSEAYLDVDQEGKIHLYTGICDPGTGAKTALAQIAAEELGQGLDDLVLVYGDTDAPPFDIGSHASRTLYVGGGAVLAAAKLLRQQMLAQAAEMLEASPGDLSISPGRVYVQGSPSRWVALSRVAEAARQSGTPLEGRFKYDPTNAPPFGAQFAEVEVDLETGQTKVLRLVAAHDVGRAINPMLVEGQVEGALHHGLGFALTEGLETDPATGKTLNPTFGDYRLNTAVDMPQIEALLVEVPDETGPFGAKGVGENGNLATAAAIANAIYDATGIRLTDLPLTDQKVLEALKRRARGPGVP